MKQLKFSAILLSSILLTACGGGSSGDNNPSLNFPASATLAEANQENGEKVAKGSISKKTNYTLNSINDSSGANSSLIAYNISNILSEYVKNLPQSNVLNSVTSNKINCHISGTVLSTINTNPTTYTATYTHDFSNCIYNAGIATNGSVSGTLQFNDNGKLSNFSFKVTKTLTISTDSMEVGSSMNVKYSVAGDKNEGIEMTISATGVENNQRYGCKACKFHTKILPNGDIQIYQTAGWLYIGNNLENYVIYDTRYAMSATPFVFSHVDGKVNVGGIAKYKSKDDKIIEIKAATNGNAELWIDGVFSENITL